MWLPTGNTGWPLNTVWTVAWNFFIWYSNFKNTLVLLCKLRWSPCSSALNCHTFLDFFSRCKIDFLDLFDRIFFLYYKGNFPLIMISISVSLRKGVLYVCDWILAGWPCKEQMCRGILVLNSVRNVISFPSSRMKCPLLCWWIKPDY